VRDPPAKYEAISLASLISNPGWSIDLARVCVPGADFMIFDPMSAMVAPDRISFLFSWNMVFKASSR